jgi:hypothetical protein
MEQRVSIPFRAAACDAANKMVNAHGKHCLFTALAASHHHYQTHEMAQQLFRQEPQGTSYQLSKH